MAKEKKSIMAKVGVWAFVIGLVIAVVFSILQAATGLQTRVIILLAILGLIVGLLNVTKKEVQFYLLATVAFIVSAQGLAFVLAQIRFLPVLASAIIVFVSPGALVASLRSLFNIARD